MQLHPQLRTRDIVPVVATLGHCVKFQVELENAITRPEVSHQKHLRVFFFVNESLYNHQCLCYNKNMIKINFEVDEDVIARYMISSSRMPKDIANYLWDKYRDAYVALKYNPKCENIDESILNELKNQQFFKECLIESYQNLDRIKSNWEKKEKQVNHFLTDLCRKEIDINLTAYILSPKMCTGVNVGNNTFFWGHKRGLEDENYDIVYLIHEALHSKFDKDNLSHAIIEKIADVELAKHLSGGVEHYKFHDFTKKQHMELFPYWTLYLNRSLIEIEQNQNYEKIFYNPAEFEYLREKLSIMDIDEFVDFVQELCAEKEQEK